MTAIERILNEYYSTENKNLNAIINEIIDDNNMMIDIVNEFVEILNHLNKEVL